LGEDAYETFGINLEDGGKFDFCKTARKPYDLAVTASLVALKKHFGGEVDISSDGDEEGFIDGKKLCQSVLGYGLDLTIENTD